MTPDGFCQKISVIVEYTISIGPAYDSPKGPLGNCKQIDEYRFTGIFDEFGINHRKLAHEPLRKEVEAAWSKIERKILDEEGI